MPVLLRESDRKARVFVKGPPYKQTTEQTFEAADKYEIVQSVSDADIVVWTGGEDISPSLYGEKPLSGTYFSVRRDESDLATIEEAYKSGKFLIGICRGAQLLNVVPNGGRLWQDVNNHGSNNHRCFDTLKGDYVTLNSVHHQMLRVTSKAQVICWAEESTRRQSQNEAWAKPKTVNDITREVDKDPEVVWYPETRSFLFQGHPEFGHPPTTRYFFSLLDDLYWGQDSGWDER